MREGTPAKPLGTSFLPCGFRLLSWMLSPVKRGKGGKSGWPPLQVVGNKWDTYLELLQLEYSEGYASGLATYFPSELWL